MRNTIALVLASTFLAACAGNPYKQTYSGTLSEKVPFGESNGFVAPSGDPKLLSTDAIGKDAVRLLEQGYFPVGRSKFRGQLIDERAAIEQARAVGADLVLVKQVHAGTSQYSIPVGDWTPDRSIVTTESTRTQDATGGNVQYVQRQAVTVISGEYQTHYEARSVDYYDHSAVYWRKVRAPRLGVYVSGLDDEQRKAIQSNKGVVIKAVVQRSPAFMADLFRGDIIRRFAGTELLGKDELFALVDANAGKKVDLEIWRDGKSLKKKIELKAD